MECDKIQEKLSAYLEDDILSSEEKKTIDAHLASCPECRKSLADLEMIVRSLRNLQEIVPPPWLTQKIMTRVKTDSEQKKKGLWQKLFSPGPVKLPLGAVGIFLVALTALYLFKHMKPEITTVMSPSEETFSEHTTKRNGPALRRKARKPSRPPAVTRSKKDEADTGLPSRKENKALPAPPAEQLLYDQEPSVKENRIGEAHTREKDMLLKSAPSPAGLSAPNALPQKPALQSAGQKMSTLSDKEDIRLSFKVSDMDSARGELEEAFSDHGGKVVKEKTALDAFIIIGELSSDKLSPFMQKLKILGYVKEKTPTPMSDKDLVLIKITISGN